MSENRVVACGLEMGECPRYDPDWACARYGGNNCPMWEEWQGIDDAERRDKEFPFMAMASKWLEKAFWWLPQEQDKQSADMVMLAMIVFVPVLVVTVAVLLTGICLELVTALPRLAYASAKRLGD